MPTLEDLVRRARCPDCSGTGRVRLPSDAAHIGCLQCGGTGVIGAQPAATMPAPPLTARQPRATMNKWETEFAAHLEGERRAGIILSWQFEAVKLRLADATYYTPDFLVIGKTGRVKLVEVKGFWRDDARVKFKVAAEMFPHFEFCAVRKAKASEGHGWIVIDRLNA